MRSSLALLKKGSREWDKKLSKPPLIRAKKL
jgi:hypothetical protein